MTELLSDNPLLGSPCCSCCSLRGGGGRIRPTSPLANGSEVRRRLAAVSAPPGPEASTSAALRVHDARGAWVELCRAIEKAGLAAGRHQGCDLRSRLIAAGYTSEHAPRVYTLVRLVMVIGFRSLLIGFLLGRRQLAVADQALFHRRDRRRCWAFTCRASGFAQRPTAASETSSTAFPMHST